MDRSTLGRALRPFAKTLALGALLLGGLAQAQTATVRLIVGYPPGGGTDAIARILAEKLQDVLGSNVMVENRSGAGGQISAQVLKAAAPDGNTFLLSHAHTISILPLVVKNPGFDPAKDFVAVAGVATYVDALAVSSGTPAKSLNEYVAWVRMQGAGKDTVGVPAPASVPEFLVKLIGQKYALDLQSAPYRGSGPMMGDMLGNQIHAGVGSVQDFIENHRAGRLRVVAVLGHARQAAMPDVPTLAELGIAGFDDVPYYGVFAPAATPKAALERFSKALAKVLALPEVRERLSAMGVTVGFTTGAQLAVRERAYTQTWARIIKASGFQAH